MLTVSLLIVALHGKVPCAAGEAHWSAVRGAVAERLESFARHIRGSREKLAGATGEALDALLEAPLRVVGHASWWHVGGTRKSLHCSHGGEQDLVRSLLWETMYRITSNE